MPSYCPNILIRPSFCSPGKQSCSSTQLIMIIIIKMMIIMIIVIMIIIMIIIITSTTTLMAFVLSIESFPLSGRQGCSAVRDDVDSSHDDDRRPDRRRKVCGHQHFGPGPNSPRCHHEDAYDKPQRQERGRTLRNPGPEHSRLDRRTSLEYLPGDQPTDRQE